MTEPVGRSVPGWRGARPVPRSAIAGRWVTVAPWNERAVGGLWSSLAGAKESQWTYMSYGPFATRQEFESAVSDWGRSEDPLFVTFEVDDRPVGWGSYLRIEPAMGVIEVGHLTFSPELQRTTAATEAMFLMARRVFEELGYRRYEWKCDALNRRSRRAAERLGFTYEGIFRNHMVYKGRNRDTAWYAITDDEWPRIGAAFEEWLDPSNFHPSGHQRRPLEEFRS